MVEVRHCCVCFTGIRECMGFVLARDLSERHVRELCGACADTLTPEEGNGSRKKEAEAEGADS